jgi:hypothetical protein
MSARSKKSLAGGILVLVALALWWMTRPEAPVVTFEQAGAPAGLPQTEAALVPATPATPRPVTNAPAAVTPPVFDEVRLEKDEVCEGEENLVTVRAHTTDGNDAFLHYTVAGQAGSQVPVRAFIGRDGTPTPQTVVAFSKNNVSSTVALPPYRVKNCRPARALVLTFRMLPNSVSEREFTATVQTFDGTPFTPSWYEWSFGDDSKDVTPGPVAVHDYATLPQKAAFTDLLVKAKAIDGSGQSVEGRLAIQILNVAFEARRRGTVTLFAEPTPRFPAVGPDGVVRQKFRLWHAEDVPVQITGATLSTLFLPENPGTAPPTPRVTAVDHGGLFRHSEIAPATFVEESLEFDFKIDPTVYAVVYELQGTTPSGVPARGQLTLMRPPPKPTRENSIPIEDPQVVFKIRRAMAILKQDTVSEEDLWRLEREGKLK